MKNQEVRLQKLLSDAGVASRRKAEEMIRQGRIKVNGRPASIGMKVVPGRQLVTIDGEKLIQNKKQKIYLALHKPRGYVTTMKDEHGRKTVVDLVEDVEERVYPVGRLDLNSEGLVIMTNDGDFANMITHPRHEIPKIYRATLGSIATDSQLAALSEGIVIDGKKTKPALIHVVSKEADRMVVRVTIEEGRNRQVRKMFDALGIEVKRLRRTQIGPVRLGMLQPGQYRHLTKSEKDVLMRKASKIQ